MSRTAKNLLLPNSPLEHPHVTPNPKSSFPKRWPSLIAMANKRPKDPTTFQPISSVIPKILHGK